MLIKTHQPGRVAMRGCQAGREAEAAASPALGLVDLLSEHQLKLSRVLVHEVPVGPVLVS